jgi:hypothetical protein
MSSRKTVKFDDLADLSEEGEEFDVEDSEKEFDDGEVSFNVPLPDRSSGRGLSALPRRRRSAEARGSDEFLRSPESFLVARDGSPIAIGDAEATESVAAASPMTRVTRSQSPSPLKSSLSPVRTTGPSYRRDRNRRLDSSPSRETQQVGRRSATIKLGTFDGRNVPLETHLAKLRNCAEYYGWSEADRVAHLKASLDGSASTLLWELPPKCSEELLLEKLNNRFGNQEMVEKFRFELRTRRRRKGESIQALYHDIQRLLALSFPGETGTLSKIVARDAFLDSLADPEMRIRILDKGATTIEQAFAYALRYESFLAGSADPLPADERDRRRVRGIHPQHEVAGADASLTAKMEKMEKSVSELTESLARFIKASQQSMSQGSGPPASASGTTAQTTSGRQQQPWKDRQRPSGVNSDRRCFKCNQPGHIARDCRREQSESAKDAAASLREIQSATGGAKEMYLSAQLKKGSGFQNVCVVLDTGSWYSVCPRKYVNSSLQPTNISLIAAEGSKISVCGRVRLTFYVDGFPLCDNFVVSDAVDEILLGQNWLCENKCIWNFADSIIGIRGREFRMKHRKLSRNVRRVIASESVLVEANSTAHVPVKLAYINLHGQKSNWLMEPQVCNDQLITARGLFSDAEDAVIQVINPVDKPVMIRRNHVFGDAEAVNFACHKCGNVCYCVPSIDEFSVSRPVGTSTVGTSPVSGDITSATAASVSGEKIITDDEVVDTIMNTLPSCITVAQRANIEKLIREYVDLFARFEYDIGGSDLLQYKLQLFDEKVKPVAEPLRNHPFAYLDLIDDEIDKLLAAKIIVPCTSTWCANVVLVKRKAEPGKTARTRVTVDYRFLNKNLERPQFPMPRNQMILDCLGKKRLFCQLDISNAYQHIKLDQETNYLTAFATRKGVYKFLRLPAGLASSASIFNQAIHQVLMGLAWHSVLVFVDDLTVACETVEQGLDILKQVFDRFRKVNFKLKVSKCKLFQTHACILGFHVSADGIRENPQRVEAIKNLPFPQTKREVRAMLGCINFARSFYKKLAEVTLPFTAMLKKNGRVEETPEARKSFETLKRMMSEAPVLTVFDPSAKHQLECDASYSTAGSCLYQIGEDGTKKIVGYMSRKFNPAQVRYCISRKELTSIIFSLKFFKVYLIGREVTVLSDHSALRYLFSTKELNDQWARHLDFLANFQVKIEYRPGSQQKISDYLSRAQQLRPCEIEANRPCPQCRTKTDEIWRNFRPITRSEVTDMENDVADQTSECDPVVDNVHENDDNYMRVNRCMRSVSFTDTAVPSLTRADASGQPRDEQAAFAGRMPENQTHLTSVQSTVRTLRCNKVGMEPVVRSVNRTSNPAPAGCPRGWTKGSGGNTNTTRAECTVDSDEKVASAGIQNEATSDVRACAQRRVTEGVEAAPCDVNFGSRMDPRGVDSFTLCVSGQGIRPPSGGHGLLFPVLGRFSQNQSEELACRRRHP